MACLLLLLCGFAPAQVVVAPAEEALLGRAEELAWSREFAMSEQLYREAGERFGPSRRQQLGLGRVLLWQARYKAAMQQFEKLLSQRVNDAEALEGLAQAAYWSGDYRQAERIFERLNSIDPSNTVALKSLAEIRSVARPLAEANLSYLDDDQPYAILTSDFSVVVFSDPLTRWSVELKRSSLEDQEAGIEGRSWSAGVGSSFKLPRWSLEAEAGARLVAFPDDEQRLLGKASVAYEPRKFWKAALRWEQQELLRTATSLDSSVYLTANAATLTYSGPWKGAASVGDLRYSDGNSGRSAEVWGLAPVFRRNEMSVSAGVSLAWKDTEDDRFQIRSVQATREGEVFRYRYDGVYDPYWTPHELLDARIVLSGAFKARGETWVTFHLDGGWARDQAKTFAPSTGPTPIPQFTFPFFVEREFHPWLAEVKIAVPFGAARLQAAYRRRATVFYTADEYEASLVRNF